MYIYIYIYIYIYTHIYTYIYTYAYIYTYTYTHIYTERALALYIYIYVSSIILGLFNHIHGSCFGRISVVTSHIGLFYYTWGSIHNTYDYNIYDSFYTYLLVSPRFKSYERLYIYIHTQAHTHTLIHTHEYTHTYTHTQVYDK